MGNIVEFKPGCYASHQGRKGPVTLEVIGPAGAGKTLTTATLRDTTEGVHLLRRVRKRENASLVAANSLALLPIVLRHLREPGRSCKLCLHSAMFLRLMDSLVESRMRQNPRAIVIDEGPIYTMAKLTAVPHLEVCRDRVEAMIERTAQRWSKRIDLVVMLDGPNEVLAERIRCRSKKHPVKGEDIAVIMSFLDSWREALLSAYERLAEYGSVPIVRLDSYRDDSGALAAELRRLIL